MRSKEDPDPAVLAAARDLAQAIYAGRPCEPTLEAFVAATSSLPVAGMDTWEVELRNAIRWTDRRWFPRPVWRCWGATNSLPPIPWLEFIHENGFRREAALRSAEEGAPNAFLLALVLRRLNDWVPQVRDAARACIEVVAARSDPGDVVAVLWATLPNLPSWGRLQPEATDAVLDLLTIDKVAAGLANALLACSAGPAPSILVQACRRPALDAALPTLAAHAVQPGVRAKASRFLLTGRASWVTGRTWVWTNKTWCEGRFEPQLAGRTITVSGAETMVLAQAARDRSAVVRRTVADVLVTRNVAPDEETVAVVKLLADDPYPSVAERARFVLERRLC